MSKYLIVNADDFGYSHGVNKGIIESYTRGIVTSTSVMVDAIAAQEAKDLTVFSSLSIGLHFVLNENLDIETELRRQIEKFVSIVGKYPDHLDSHKKHTTTEGVKEVLEVYAKKLDIPVRGLADAKFIDLFFAANSNGDVSINRLKNALDQATDEYNELMCHVGHSDDYLREHSSYSDLREEELKSICSPVVKQYVHDKDLVLISWRDVPKHGA